MDDMSFMFKECKYLKELPNISRIVTSNIKSMNVMLESVNI